MLNPQMPNISGSGAVTDTLEFVKNLWGSMAIPGIGGPGMAAPTVSIDDLDKKIADLKAVESWLNVNMSMLHGTIQALEIQRGTLATLKAMGASFAAAVQPPPAASNGAAKSPPAAASAPSPSSDAAPAEGEGDAAAAAMPNPALWWNLLQDQFKQAVTAAMSPEAIAGATAMAQDAAAKMTGAAPAEPAEPKPRAAKSKTGKAT